MNDDLSNIFEKLNINKDAIYITIERGYNKSINVILFNKRVNKLRCTIHILVYYYYLLILFSLSNTIFSSICDRCFAITFIIASSFPFIQ